MRRLLVATISLLAIGCRQLPANESIQNVSQSQPATALQAENVPPTTWIIQSIDWDDADSGDINGVRFRLYNIDAPETGGVGAAVGAAECDLERERGLQAKAWMVETTPPAVLRITATHGYDKMSKPRLLIDLAANGQDVAKTGVVAGYLQPWPHRGSKSLAAKPDWCKP